MKNLFRYLAASLSDSVFANQHAVNKYQNNHSDHVHATFFTPGGDMLQTYEKFTGDIVYGAIQIQLRTSYIYLSDAAYVLQHLLEGLQKQWFIVHTTDSEYWFAKKAFEHLSTAYWQDAAGTDWKVCGWTNGQAMAIRYIKNVNASPVWQEDVFLGSIGSIRA